MSRYKKKKIIQHWVDAKIKVLWICERLMEIAEKDARFFLMEKKELGKNYEDYLNFVEMLGTLEVPLLPKLLKRLERLERRGPRSEENTSGWSAEDHAAFFRDVAAMAKTALESFTSGKEHAAAEAFLARVCDFEERSRTERESCRSLHCA